MIQLPSITFLYEKAKHAAFQYPLTLLSSLLGVLLSIYLVEIEGEVANLMTYINLLLIFALGIPLFFAIGVFCKKLKFDTLKTSGFYAAGMAFLVAVYFTFPTHEDEIRLIVPYIKYGIYNVAIHLLVSFIPYLTSKQVNGFWQYNRLLFERIILSAIYSGFLYAGISLALASLYLLFDIKVDEEIFLYILIIISGFFNTWFFISGMPDDFDKLDEIKEYPLGLKIFSQYILLPLLLLYIVILYFYGAKIMLLWDWPKGIVTWLIFAVSVLGIFTSLLIYPFGEKAENSWIKKFSKAYYFVLAPLVVILFIAIGMRLSDYGITINRYVILLLGIWLSVVCLYFMLGRRNIKFIPVSLCAAMILASFGPWGMFSVSERSQSKRLKAILTEHEFLVDGKVVNEQTVNLDSSYYNSSYENINAHILSDSVHNEVLSIMNYLADFHGFSAVNDIFEQDLEQKIANYRSIDTMNFYLSEKNVYMNALGLDEYKIYTNSSSNRSSFIYYSAEYGDDLIEIAGYDYMSSFSFYNRNYNQSKAFKIEKDNYEIMLNEKNSFLIDIYKNEARYTSISLNAFYDELQKKYSNKDEYNIPKEEMSFTGTSDSLSYKMTIQNISIELEDDEPVLYDISGKLLFSFEQ